MPAKPIRILPDGPIGVGLQPCRLIPEENIISGHGHSERMHNFFHSGDGRITVGVWESTPCKDRCEYDVDEACYILSGKAVVASEDGETWTFAAGDCFVIPRGFKGTWETVETLRKIHFIYE